MKKMITGYELLDNINKFRRGCGVHPIGIKKGWKVVKKDGDKLYSSNAKFNSVEYNLGEWTSETYKGRTEMLVFTNMADAVEFIRNSESDNLKLFACEYIPGSSFERGVAEYVGIGMGEHWRWSTRFDNVCVDPWEPGTDFAKEVLIKAYIK